jgi:phosphate transport system protein
MENLLETGIQNLRQKILLMASLAGAAVNLSVQSLNRRDLELALQVKQDDHLIDEQEVTIDEFAIQLLTQAPLAADLRFVTASLRITQNLERIGDEAAKIAKRARDLAREPALKLPLDYMGMAGETLELLNDALDAFVQADPGAARKVIPRDRHLDELYRQMEAGLIQHMTQNAGDIVRCLHWLVALKSLERIGDHATNVAEEVVFLWEAQDIRHSGIKHQTAPA